MVLTNVQKAEKERDTIKTTLAYLESKLAQHSTTPIPLSKLELHLTMVNAIHDKILSNHETIALCAPPDMVLYNTEYVALLDSVSDLQCDFQDIKNSITTVPSSAPSATSTTTEIRLPRMELPTFNGNLQDWMPFKDLFISAVHSNTKLSKAQKLTYLKSSLIGEAANQIKSLTLSDANYDIAWAQMTERYQNERELLFVILHRFIGQPNVQVGSSNSLRTLIDVSKECFRSLTVLKRPVEQWDDLLLFHMFQKLDQSSRELWEQSLKDSSIPTLKMLLDFLEQRARALAAGGVINSKVSKVETQPHKKINHFHHTQPSSSQSSISCKMCCNNHFLFRCTKFISMPVSERFEFVKKNSLCINCFRDGHSATKCTSFSTCRTCSGRHHTLLHKQQSSKVPETAKVSESTKVTESNKDPSSLVLGHHCNLENQISQTILATALVRVQDSLGQPHFIRALLDGGSSSSFISEFWAQKLGLTRHRTFAEIVGLASASLGTANRSASLVFTPHFDSNNTYEVNCLILAKVTGTLPIYKCDPSVWPHLRGLQLSDPNFHQPANVDLLLGADIFWNLLVDGKRTGSSDAPIALRSTLGWLVAGNVNPSATQVRVHYGETKIDEFLKRFWELESMPTTKILSIEETKCEQHFETTFKRDANGIFTVTLPFKASPPVLGQSRDIAIRRHKQVERRLLQQPENQQQYTAFMQEYLSLGHMEKVSAEDIQNSGSATCYIPHHFVLKLSSSTTKFRVVFDASAKTSSGVSLNETLMVGPQLQDHLTTLLMRFRTHIVAFTADVAKMYRQIRISKSDADFQRIVWREDPNQPMQDYRLLTVTYGTAPAPYLATKCLQKLAEDEKELFPLASSVALNDFYVDDLMSGAPSVEAALEIQNQLVQLTAKGGFDLRKWSSNSPELLQAIPPEKRESQNALKIESDQSIKTLGVFWNPVADNFFFKINLPDTASSEQLTKRKLLSEIAKIFDPLGWLAPVIIRAKIIIQKLWKLTIDWDDTLPKTIQQEWITYKNNLSSIEQISIPRSMMLNTNAANNLIGFCDASEQAYAAVVYLCVSTPENTSQVSMISSKTRVAPAKTISLPRLELCGAVLLSQLMVNVKESLNITINNTAAWSDSTIVLAFIKSDPSRWKTFVANRVTEIQQHLSPDLWGHVSGIENPADCASRGIDPTELKNHPLWWKGPGWLQGPFRPPQWVPVETDIEQKSTIICNHITTDTSFFRKYSSLRTLKRVVAYALRFYNNCRAKVEAKKSQSVNQIQSDQLSSVEKNKSLFTLQFGPLTSDELNKSLFALVKCVQAETFHHEIQCLKKQQSLPTKSSILTLNPFLDESQVLRVGGRLRNSALPHDQKTPMLLPRHHSFTKLLILSKHLENYHAGPQLLLSILNQTFWIVGAKDAVRHQLNKCVVCTRHRATTLQQLMSDLPSFRVTPSRPFSKCGIDYAGPFNLRAIPARSKVTFKAYLALFVCFATRAVHLEVVSSLTTEAFLAALKRFIARRGIPSDIFSDCGTNFVGAAKEMKEMILLVKSAQHNEQITNKLSHHGTQWHFHAPSSPHFGGLWEAGVKSAKYHLYRVIGSTRLTFEEFTTVMTQIEACMNSRPLTPFSTDPSDYTALTPGHFLIGAPLTALPEPDITHEKIGRLTRFQLIQQIHQHFWHRWSSEYLSRLQQRPKWLKQRSEIKVNDLVLIKDDRFPPMKWPLGRVRTLHPGTDGLTRVVTLTTAEGQLKRPIVKLCLLPINNDNETI